MARISSYPVVTPKAIDTLIISQGYDIDADNPIEGNPTGSVTIGSVIDLVNTGLVPGTGTVTSLGVSMPSAFTVSNTPVTTAGVINITGSGTSAQYIDGTGSLQSSELIFNRDSTTNSLGNKTIQSDFNFSSIPASYANSIWNIVHHHDLGGATVTLPVGVTLNFTGGKFSNGTLTGDNTKINSFLVNIFDTDTSFSGTWSVKEVYPQWFGAVGDGIQDDTEAITKLVAMAQELGFAKIIFSAEGGSFFTTSTINFNSTCDIDMASPIKANVGLGEKGIVVSGGTNRTYVLSVYNSQSSTWGNEEEIAIQLKNTNSSSIHIKQARGFTVGVEFIGDAGGFAYNDVTLGDIGNNKVGINLTNINNGWCNENLFYNGRLWNYSTFNSSISRYGARITSKDGIYNNNNNNVFIKTSFELKIPSVGESIPILLEHAVNNRFIYFRNEQNSDTVCRIVNDSTENVIHSGYGSCAVEDLSNYPNTKVTRVRTENVDSLKSVIFKSGELNKKATPYNTTYTYIPNVHLAASHTASPYQAINIGIEEDYVEVLPSRGIGVFVSTEKVKELVIRKDVETDFGGRIYIRCYDSSGNILTNTGSNHPYVRTTIQNSAFWSSSFGGAYSTGSDDDGDYFITIGEDVKSIDVVLAGGTNNLKIRSFSISSKSGYDADVWSGVEEVSVGNSIGTQAPTTGTWAVGKTIYNSTPASGGVIGWVCVISGTPGTWKSFGTIES